MSDVRLKEPTVLLDEAKGQLIETWDLLLYATRPGGVGGLPRGPQRELVNDAIAHVRSALAAIRNSEDAA